MLLGVDLLTLENLAAAVVLLGLVMYAVFGEADFGGGIWIALARGPRAREQRAGLFQAIGPVWETNHVWLILVIVTLFTAFPRGFAALFTALLVPLVIALVGITFRGAAFAFQHFGEAESPRLPGTTGVFSLASLLTPLAMGMAVASVAAGRIQWLNGHVEAGAWSAWITPFTVMGGLVGVSICAFLTPIYMAVRTTGKLREDFRAHGLVGALVLGAVTTLALPVAWFDAPAFAERLLSLRALLFVAAGVVLGLSTLGLLWTRRYPLAQLTAAGAVTAVIAGFGVAMYPELLIGQLTFEQAAAPRGTLSAFLTALPFGALILVPSLIFLYWTFRGDPNPELTAEGIGQPESGAARAPQRSVEV